MKRSLSAKARHLARTETRAGLQHLARQPDADEATTRPAGSASRQQSRRALRPYLSR